MSTSMASGATTESEGLLHPFESSIDGPKGAYEARQTKGGLYIRVDIPGCPPDAVKITKNKQTNTINFNASAPGFPEWSLDNSARFYGGYVVLDKDPTTLDVEQTVENGCLRLFIPGVVGNLEYFPRKMAEPTGLGVLNVTAGESSSLGEVHQPELIFGVVSDVSPHDAKCVCCNGIMVDLSKKLYKEGVSRINPFVMSGLGSVCETKLVRDGCMWWLYLRVDFPGPEKCRVLVDPDLDGFEIWGGLSRREYHLEKEGRKYCLILKLGCDCCKIMNVQHRFSDGVVRLLANIISIATIGEGKNSSQPHASIEVDPIT